MNKYIKVFVLCVGLASIIDILYWLCLNQFPAYEPIKSIRYIEFGLGCFTIPCFIKIIYEEIKK